MRPRCPIRCAGKYDDFIVSILPKNDEHAADDTDEQRTDDEHQIQGRGRTASSASWRYQLAVSVLLGGLAVSAAAEPCSRARRSIPHRRRGSVSVVVPAASGSAAGDRGGLRLPCSLWRRRAKVTGVAITVDVAMAWLCLRM